MFWASCEALKEGAVPFGERFEDADQNFAPVAAREKAAFEGKADCCRRGG